MAVGLSFVWWKQKTAKIVNCYNFVFTFMPVCCQKLRTRVEKWQFAIFVINRARVYRLTVFNVQYVLSFGDSTHYLK